MTMGMSGQMTEAARAQENPFGLVYQNAITKNESGKVNIRPVTYEVEGIAVAANLCRSHSSSRNTPTMKRATRNMLP